MIANLRSRAGYVLAISVLMAFVVVASFAASESSGAQTPDGNVDDVLAPGLDDTLSGLGEGEDLGVILTFEDRATTETQTSEVTNLVGADSITEFDRLPMIALSGTAAEITQLASLDGVLSVYPNKELDYFLDESRETIEADRVEQELGFTGDGVGVAVIDSGIDGTKLDVEYNTLTPEEGRTIQNVKFAGVPGSAVAAENLVNSDTSSGHGTHVSSTAAGDGALSNGRYTGIAPEADLVGLGTGDTVFVLYALEGFDYVLEHQDEYDIRVINNSYGTTGAYDPDDPLNVASKQAHDAGMTVVFAGGNEGPGNNTMNPYALPDWVIGVAAGEKDGQTLADFSSRGVPGSTFDAPDITAPGVDIAAVRSTTCGVCLSPDKDLAELGADSANYTVLSGTSMATPHVTGVVALMEEANASLTPDQIKSILEDTANPMLAEYEYHEVGAGYLDAYDAVKAAQAVGDGGDGGDDGSGGNTPPACTVTGTNGNNSLRGTAGDDVICGLGGNDNIRGLGGNDIIRGGNGVDSLLGDAGRDQLYGQAGNDSLRTEDGKGNDLANGGPGTDSCRADRGDTRRSCERSQ